MRVPSSTSFVRAAWVLPIAVALAAIAIRSTHRPQLAAVTVLVGAAFAAATAAASGSRSVPSAAAASHSTSEALSSISESASESAAHRPASGGAARRLGARLSGVFVVLAVGSAYFATLSPTTNATDSIEFQLVAATLRIAHAPGYALYTLLGHAMTALPVGDVAWRMNVLSAWCGTIAAALAFALARRLAGDPLAGVVAALALAFTPQLWSQAVITEVYTLNVVLVLGILTCLARLRRARVDGRWRLGALVLCGLGFTHHLTTVLVYPVVAWLVLWRDPKLLSRGGDVLRSALAFVVGLAPLLYFPWRWQRVNGERLDVPTLLGFVTGRNYPGLLDLSRLPNEPARWVLLRHEVAAAYGPLTLALAVLGLAALAARRRLDWAVALTAVFAAFSLFYLGYFAWDGWVVLLPALVALAIAAGIGAASAAALAGRTPRTSSFVRAGVAAMCTAALTVSLARTWPRVDASRGWSGQAAADAALAEPIPHGARLVVDPTVGAGFLYARHLKGTRTDLDVVYADWPAGRRALADPLAQDRVVVAYGIARDALPTNGVLVVPIGPLQALLPPEGDTRPAGLSEPPPADERAGDPDRLVGWRTLTVPARAGPPRVLPGDDVIVQLAWRRTAGGSDRAADRKRVRARLVEERTGHASADGGSNLEWVQHGVEAGSSADAHVEVRLALARDVRPGPYTVEVSLDDAAWRALGAVTVSPLTRSVLTQDPAFVDVAPVRRAWPDGTTLVGIEAPASVGAGEALHVRAYWAHPAPSAARGGSVRLEDRRIAGESIGADGPADLPSGVWPGGTDAVWVTRHVWTVAPDVPCDRSASLRAVRCALGAGALSAQLVRRVDAASSDQAFGRPWRLPRVAARPASPGMAGPVRFDGGVVLDRFRPRQRIARPGAWLAVDTRWSADRRPDQRDKAFVQLLDAAQSLRSSSDREVLYGAEPMDEWRSGEIHKDTFFVRVPPEMPPGLALVQIGLYDRDTRERRAVLGSDGVPADDRVLTGIYIDAVSNAPPPELGAAADIEFTGGPRLTGIAAASSVGIQPGNTLTVTLRWHVDAALLRDWTVFVHLLADPSGAPTAQADGMPLGPHFPTHLWPPNATLESTHVLTVGDGALDASGAAGWTVAIGLYDGVTLERAAVAGQLADGWVDVAERRARWPLGGGAGVPTASTAPTATTDR